MIVLYDKRLPEGYKEALGIKLPGASHLPVGRFSDVYDSISCHPDIYFFKLDEKTLVHAPSITEEALEPLRESGLDLIKGEDDPRGPYPGTVRYNAARTGGAVFAGEEYIDPVVMGRVKKKGLKMVNVPQGYARCSTLAVSDDAIITSDEGVASAARLEGLKVLEIAPGSISLPGEKTGFIGGAGGRCPDGTVVFLGDIDLHPEGDKIKTFLKERRVRCIGIKGLPLYDAGGLFILRAGSLGGGR